MKGITFYDSFTPIGATDLVMYDNGSSPSLWVEDAIFPLTRKPRDGSAHPRSRCSMV